jgi:uncharacterized protein YyaL (SSP411 family)
MPKSVNRLSRETSPYLLQHARNPVDWYPWGEEALARARDADKPILVSIGYSACHWCHVMEQESFEDTGVARVMNEHFICIKVDREERPDLDKIYQTAHQILTGRPGGWPLNMFLTPQDQMPFFGGTYFPKAARFGMPGFTDILARVAAFYRERRDAVTGQNGQLREIFDRLQPTGPNGGAQAGAGLLARARESLIRQHDRHHGGFGGAPKFPHPTSLDLLLRRWARARAAGEDDPEALAAAHRTLRAMALGGIFDQVGGGFCRYSVDERWEIPHFEKMLYDNGQLLSLYADGFAATGDALLRDAAIGIAEWALREMQSPGGGYYSSLDADSEGHEGKFYVWEAAEVRALLDDNEFALIAARYGLGGAPNFEGRFHLHTQVGTPELAVQFQRSEDEVIRALASAHKKLFVARERRVRPGRDDKILTSWNALMIRGMARAAWRLGRDDFLKSAECAFDFLRAHLWKEGRLLATAKDGRAHLNAYLDDYAFLIDAGLELLQARWRAGDLDFIASLADALLAHFEDREHGGFFFTSDDHERLAYRPKPGADDALPSGNGVAAQVLARLGHLLGRTDYLEAAGRALDGMSSSISQAPSAHGALLLALDEHLFAAQTVVLRGTNDELGTWLEMARGGYVPWRYVLAIGPNEKPAGMLALREAKGGVTAYVCEGQRCAPPATAREQLARALAGQ